MSGVLPRGGFSEHSRSDRDGCQDRSGIRTPPRRRDAGDADTEHAPRRPRGQPRHGAAAIGAGRQVMCPSAISDVERHLCQRRQHFGTLDEIDRRHDGGVAAPRVDAGRKCGDALRRSPIDRAPRNHMKTLLQFRGPRRAQPGGARARARAPRAALAQLGGINSAWMVLPVQRHRRAAARRRAAQHRERRVRADRAANRSRPQRPSKDRWPAEHGIARAPCEGRCADFAAP